MHKLGETSLAPPLELVLGLASPEARGPVEEEWLLRVKASKQTKKKNTYVQT